MGQARTDPSTQPTGPPAISLYLVSFVTAFGTQVIPPALPGVADAFGVSATGIGLVMTVYTLPGILTVPIIGVLADVYGRRAVLIPTFLAAGILGLGIALADDYLAVLVLRFGQGIVAAGLMPIVTTMLGDLFEGPVGTTAQGTRLGVNGVGNVVVPAVAGFLSGLSWNYPFLLYAIAVPVLVMAYVVLPETGGRGEFRGIGREFRLYVASIRPALTDRSILVLVAGGFFRGFGLYALLTFLPLFADQELGVSAFVIGVVLAVRGVLRVISPMTGRLLRFVSRRRGLLAGLLIMALGTALIPVAPDPVWLALAFGLFGLGDAVLLPIHRDSVAVLTVDDNRAGVYSGVSLMRKVGTTISPILFGFVLAAVGFIAVFAAVALVFVAYAAAVAAYFSGG